MVKKRFKYEYYLVRTENFQEKVAEMCISFKDVWAAKVKGVHGVALWSLSQSKNWKLCYMEYTQDNSCKSVIT